MNAVQTSYVRQHQACVLASLQLALKPVTPGEIASLLNAHRHETHLPRTDPIEVEASLAAMMLRPYLRDYISCKTRRATEVEASRRRRLGLGSLSTVVILSACTAVRQPIPAVPNGPALHSYFGGATPVAKADPSPTRPVFNPASFAQAYTQALEITTQDPQALASKTPVEPSDHLLASYFDEQVSFDRSSHRKEADLVPELKVAKTTTPSPRMVAVQVPALPLITLSLPHEIPTHAPVISASKTPEPAPHVQPVRAATTSSEASCADPRFIANPPRNCRLDLGDKDRPDVYSDLIAFNDGSISLSPVASKRVADLVNAAKHAEAIQLRGRVGFHQLDQNLARMAFARAFAVRAALEAHGVPRSKIRIYMPRNDDLIVAGDPNHEWNRSVSVFMVVPKAQATALGLHHGMPILTASLKRFNDHG